MTFDIPPSGCTFNIVLAANVSQTITVPTGANHVLFAPTAGLDFFFKFGSASIAVPSSNNVAGSGLMCNRVLMQLGGATAISVVSGAAGVLTMEFFQ
jgi:hypothetical protein